MTGSEHENKLMCVMGVTTYTKAVGSYPECDIVMKNWWNNLQLLFNMSANAKSALRHFIEVYVRNYECIYYLNHSW